MSSNKTCSIAFTLPISCQICLGKVKQPVICPNQHVFCQVCLEFWLSRSPHCPACRVQITKDNPCRPILGGLNDQQNAVKEDFSNRDMRRTRVEVLFKDYESELERLERQNELLKEENKMLTERLDKSAAASDPAKQYGQVDEGRIKLLMSKLQEAAESHEKHKKEIKSLKEENKLLKEENGKTGIENQKLRMEVVSRSPRRYGRTTVVAMESQLDKYKKECSALNKALEKSDAYVEDLEKELEKYKQMATQRSSQGHDMDKGQTKKQGALKLGQKPKGQSQSLDEKYTRPSGSFDDFDSSDYDFKAKLHQPANDTFDLELPSPVTKGSKAMSKLALETTSSEDGLSFLKGQEETSLLNDTEDTDANDLTLEMPSPVQNAKKRLKFSENTANAKGPGSYAETGLIQSNRVKTGLDVSMSGDIEDCMKILEEAERKVEMRKGQLLSGQGGGQELNPRNPGLFERSMSHTGSMGSLSGLIANAGHQNLAPTNNMKKAGSSHSLTSSIGSASTLTLGHFNTDKPSTFASSMPPSRPNNQGIIPGINSSAENSTQPNGLGLNVKGNFQAPSAPVSGNFQAMSTAISGDFLSQPNFTFTQSVQTHGKYSASNPFVKGLSQETKRF